jgi:DNA-binding XRE family transcriptional regulator
MATTKKIVEKKKEIRQPRSKRGTQNPFVANPNSAITKTICGNIKKLYVQKKKESNWSQAKFANYIGVPEPYIKGVLQNKYAPSHAVLLQISKLFNKKMDWLYGLVEIKDDNGEQTKSH